MTNKPVYLTKEGIEALKAEKEELEKVKMPQIADKINRAKELGDLKENAEYHEAKEQMGFAQGRVTQIERQLLNAVVIEGSTSSDSVQLGSRVSVVKDGKEKEFMIVGAQEADPIQGKISNESPLGAAFLGKRIGDVVKVETPKGEVLYNLKAIN